MRKWGTGGLVAALVALGAATAHGGGPDIQASNDTGYDTPAPSIPEGTQAVFLNNDTQVHTVTADDKWPEGGRLFESGFVDGPGITGGVAGTEFLDAGAYDFHCEVHTSTMQGTLTVTNSASGPVARPELRVKVKSKKLEDVLHNLKLKLKLKAVGPTDADNIRLKAKKGRKAIGSKTLDLSAGESKKVRLRISGRGEQALEGLSKARIKVSATVDLGFGDKAAKKLK